MAMCEVGSHFGLQITLRPHYQQALVFTYFKKKEKDNIYH